MMQPYSDGPLWAFVPGERAVFVLDRRAPTNPAGAEIRLTKLAFSGATLFTRTHVLDAVPVLDANVAAHLDVVSRIVGQGGINGATPALARQWAEASFYRPDNVPPVRAMLVGQDGTIWLGLNTRTSPGQWLILGSQGEPIGRVGLPAEIYPRLVDGPHLWASESGELGVPYLVRYVISE